MKLILKCFKKQFVFIIRIQYSPLKVLKETVNYAPPPFEEEAVYCFANVGRSVGPSICLYVCRSVDQMVIADYLKNQESSFFTCILVMTSRPLLILGSLGQRSRGICVLRHFLFLFDLTKKPSVLFRKYKKCTHSCCSNILL